MKKIIILVSVLLLISPFKVLSQDVCEGNFDCDHDVDGSDAFPFKQSFGRSPVFNPCTPESQCNGDFNCDQDCDGTDAALFKQDFGRGLFSNPCPACLIKEPCVYIPGACGDVFPQDYFGGTCGDGIIDMLDVLEMDDIMQGLEIATACQLSSGDVPNGIPPNCGNPSGSQNCKSDGDIDIFDTMVILDKAAGRINCCDYCSVGPTN